MNSENKKSVCHRKKGKERALYVTENWKMFLKLKSSSSLDLFALIGSTHWRKLASDSGDADPPRPSSSGFPLP